MCNLYSLTKGQSAIREPVESGPTCSRLLSSRYLPDKCGSSPCYPPVLRAPSFFGQPSENKWFSAIIEARIAPEQGEKGR
jgi:hypothetical protein